MARKPPILEYPGDAISIIDPGALYPGAPTLPEHAVLCFFDDVLRRLRRRGQLERVFQLTGEGPPIDVWLLQDGGTPLTICWPGIGAPYAAAVLEELIGLGVRGLVSCGGAGALDRSLDVGQVVIPTAALRAEGTSYHYQRRGRWARPHPAALSALRAACRKRQVPYRSGKTWTTDGVFRETPAAIRQRRAEGCLVVEMEAAAQFAVARFREVPFGALLYAGDDVSGPTWDHRGWLGRKSVREQLFWLAVDAARAMRC